MAVSEQFKGYVENGDRMSIKVSLSGIIRNDMTYKMFEEYMDFLNEQNFDIYEKHDGENYSNVDYSEDFLRDQLNQLIRNFSKERLRCIKVIQHELYGNVALEQRKAEIKYDKKNKVKKVVGSFFIAGGTILTIGSVMVNFTGLVVVGSITIVGGIVLILTSREK